jgi:hypothetical protein
MRMMSKRDEHRTDQNLEMAKLHLLGCLRRMKGKYGTRLAVRAIERALMSIDDCAGNEEFKKDIWQKFRTPPNTPKSRRLGWHKEGEVK